MRDVSREQLAAVTKISARHIEALETGRFDALPALVFSRGFVGAIASYLGLDAERTTNGFRSVYESWAASQSTKRSSGPASGTHPGLRSKRPVSATSTVIGVGVAATLALVTGVAAVMKSRSAEKPIAAPAPAADPATTGPESLALPPSVAAATVALPADAVVPQPVPARFEGEASGAAGTALTAVSPVSAEVSRGQRTLTLTFKDDCWTEVAVEGRVVAAQLFKRGESRTFSGAGRFTLTLGNAGGVDVAVDGRAIASIGGQGQVVRNFVVSSL